MRKSFAALALELVNLQNLQKSQVKSPASLLQKAVPNKKGQIHYETVGGKRTRRSGKVVPVKAPTNKVTKKPAATDSPLSPPSKQGAGTAKRIAAILTAYEVKRRAKWPKISERRVTIGDDGKRYFGMLPYGVSPVRHESIGYSKMSDTGWYGEVLPTREAHEKQLEAMLRSDKKDLRAALSGADEETLKFFEKEYR